MDPQSYVLDVLDVVEETADAHSITFAVPAEAPGEFEYKPGQFITVAVPSDQTGIAARCYSLCSSPEPGDDRFTITVKRTAAGYASNWICDNLKAGGTLRALPPSGIFTPKDWDVDLLLFAGGSGITPVMSILRTALARGERRVTLFYANRDERSVIFAAELRELAAAHPERLRVVHWLESVQGLPTPELMTAFAGDHSSWTAFVCGPSPFMKMTTAALKGLGFPRERRHQEKFISLGGNPFGELPEDEPEVEQAVAEIAEAESEAGGGPAADGALEGRVRLEVELDGETHVFDDWDPKTKLLDHLLDKGVFAPYSCREGECSACAIRLVEGEVDMAHNEVLDDEDLAEGLRLACQATPTTDTVRGTYS